MREFNLILILLVFALLNACPARNSVITPVIRGLSEREICVTDTFVVDTVDELEPNVFCGLGSNPCTLVGAISSAILCRDSGPMTVRLGQDQVYTLSNKYVPPLIFYDEMIGFESSTGPVGLPRIFGNITIEGQGSTIERSETAPDFRFFHVTSDSSLTLKDLVVRNGTTAGRDGGGIYNQGDLTLENSTLENNRVSRGNGGAIYNEGQSSVREDSKLISNQAVLGGGVYNAGEVEISGSRLESNRSGALDPDASAIYNDTGATLQINNSSFLGNGDGTVIQNRGELVIDQTTFANNTVRVNAVCISNLFATATIKRSTFSSNVGGTRGQIYCGDGATLDIIDTTIYQNSSERPDSAAGGISTGGSCTIRRLSNTIIASRSPHDCALRSMPSGTNLDTDGTCGATITADPLLEPLQDNGGSTHTHMPRSGSPAINAGAECMPTDQRGEPRSDGRCDIGSVER